MTKYPKSPYESLSPFEQQLRKKTEFRAEEQKETKGCGDPYCDICNQRFGEGNPSKGKPSMDKDDFIQAIYMNLVRNEGRPVYMGLDPARPSESPEFLAARKAVEDFILEVPPEVSWDDVAGNEAAKSALLEAVEHPITKADLYAHYGLKPLSGVLLWGPPGCGKTMFGKAAASAVAKLHGAKAEMLCINGAALQSPWVGETERQITAFFTYARLYREARGHPLVIFIDEADAILPSRAEGRPWQVQNVSTFLAEMDGLRANAAFVILATNRPETIDEAVLRDGRCDRKIKVERPGLAEAKVILDKGFSNMPLAEPLNGEAILDYFLSPLRIVNSGMMQKGNKSEPFNVTLANIMSGAMLASLANRSKTVAFRRDLAEGTITGVTLSDIFAAIDELVKENENLPHTYAVMEMIEALNLREETEKARILN